MSKTTAALLMKFLATLGVMWITLGFVAGSSFTWVLIVAIVGTGMNYVLGDLFVLPSFGNVIASIGDGVMAALVAYIISFFTRDLVTTLPTLFTLALLVIGFELLFHTYLKDTKKVAP